MSDKDTSLMTDLEFCDHYIERCQRFVNPKLLREADGRGLIRFLDFLPYDIPEAKAVLRARMSKERKYFGNEEIDKFQGEIGRLNVLRDELSKVNIANTHELLPILEKMQEHAINIRDYFKPINV